MRIVGTVEARMGSTRLPGKTLMPIYKGKPLLECVVRRFKQCKQVDELIVATTRGEKDNPIAEWCEKNNVSFYRGSEYDVLNRVVNAARTMQADAIAQMGADSAYLDFELMDQLINIYKSGDYDYVCNDLKLTYPLGIYGHIVRMRTLETLNERTDLSEADRVDVVRSIFEHPEKYKVKNIEAGPDFAFSQLRFTIDYPQDMDQAREIYAHFKGTAFSTRDLLDLYRQRPELFKKTKNLIQHSAAHLPAQS